MTVQSLVMRKIYDPDKMKAQVAAEIAARRKEERRGVKSTTIQVKDEKTGKVEEKQIFCQRDEQAPSGVCPPAGC